MIAPTSADKGSPEAQAHGKLLESFDRRIRNQNPDYLAEIFGWRVQRQSPKSTLPYWDPQSLAKVREVGRLISTKPTGISAMSKLISFVIGSGHAYSCAARLPAIKNKRELARQERTSAEIKATLKLACEEIGWYGHQLEAYERLIRDGEFFRRFWPLEGTYDITYIEPEDVDQPTEVRQIVGRVPDTVLELFDGARPPGELGIVSDPDDVRRVLGYWVRVPIPRGRVPNRDEQFFEFVGSQSVQHGKEGVDKNDPRGVPRFYYALCHILGIDEIDGGMRDLFLVQAKHAAVYNYNQGTLITNVRQMAQGDQGATDDNDGRPEGPGTVHAKGFSIELPGVHVAAKDAVEIIQQEQRLVGGCSDIPEHLISEDANTGNRSSLVAAEGPFDRRIQREQLLMWAYDREFLWRLVARKRRLKVRGLADLREEMELIPHFPVAQARDRDKEIESEIALFQAGIKSKQQVQATLKIPGNEAAQENTLEPPEDPIATSQAKMAANNRPTGDQPTS